LHANKATIPLVLIQADANRGFAAGNNIGISYATKQNDFAFVWLLNNDTVIDANALKNLVKKAENCSKANMKVGIVTSKLLYYYHPEIIQAIGGRYNKWFAVSKHIGSFQKDDGSFDIDEVNMHYPIGASMLVSKEFIDEVGFMCEDYFLYYEEMDWSVRGKQKGFVNKYSYQSKVFHKEGASIGSGHTKLKSELSDIYSIKNRFKFASKFYPMYLPTVYAGLIPVIFNRFKRKQVKRAYRILKAVFSEVIK
jgi:GT2 family glycosyltransferase